jgi:sulfur-oxidizing protein SoxA
MQLRLSDCFRQQRTAEPVYVSDATIALSVYMAANANGGVMLTPGIKR